MKPPERTRHRRDFLAGSAALATSLLANQGLAATPTPAVQGRAEHVISIWLGGGMGQIDTFDPKRKGDPKNRKAGSYYDAI
ncbi:MAG TPA: DUF1501 domain-containing protein, partial [Planctomycetaceae bacterium]|nr:DUF1501 domain-containing protein [Planctomycetaceae bacterium]